MSGPPRGNSACGGVREHVEPPVTKSLNRQDLLLLFLGDLFDLGDELVGGLLDGVVAAPLVVLRDFLVLGHRLELVIGLPTDIPNGHAGVLGVLAYSLGELLPSLLG